MSDLFGDDTGPRAVARLFLRGADPAESDETVGFSLRTSASRLAMLDVMAANAGLSRNRMAIAVLNVGMDAVMAELPEMLVEEMHNEWLTMTTSEEFGGLA